MSLKYYNINKAIPTESEELFIEAFNLYEKQLNALMDQAWEYEQYGHPEKALICYEAGNIYYYLTYYAIAIRTYLQGQGVLNDKCNSVLAECKYKISCVETNLPCLSKTYSQDYTSIWKKITNLFNIDRDTANCNDCCVGIGEMIIEGIDDCNAFIIGGDCLDRNDNISGEFVYIEFTTNQRTKPKI